MNLIVVLLTSDVRNSRIGQRGQVQAHHRDDDSDGATHGRVLQKATRLRHPPSRGPNYPPQSKCSVFRTYAMSSIATRN